MSVVSSVAAVFLFRLPSPGALLGPAVSPAGVGVRVGGVVVAAAGVHLLKHGPVLLFNTINLSSYKN